MLHVHAKNSHGGGHDCRSGYQAKQAKYFDAAEDADEQQQFIKMGAIAKHYQIEEAVRLAIEAGEDMLLICARPELIRRGYHSLLQAARDGVLTADRINLSLRRIAVFKALTRPPLPFDAARFAQYCEETAALNRKLNYTYGGKI